MQKIAISILIFLTFATCISCEKEEKPIDPHNPGDNLIAAVSLGGNYQYQAFFDLGSNQMVASNPKVDWDLGFECGEDGSHVILNSSKMMKAAAYTGTDFSSATDTLGMHFEYDDASGNLNGTAIGNWNPNEIFVIDRGNSDNGTHLGFKKIQLQLVDDFGYELRYANLDGSDEVIINIVKDNEYNFTFLKLDQTGTIVSIEPAKNDWDLCFSQYTDILMDAGEPHPYLVTGVLCNRYEVESIQVLDISYEDLTIEDVIHYTLSSDIDLIGYDWKNYDFDLGYYTVDPNLVYIIKSTEGMYYKLHFIDFYNDQGQKGNPKFEFQEL